MDYRLRPATAADRNWLEQLRRDAYAGLYDATWGGWDEARHQRHFDESWHRGGILVIEVDGHAAGMLQVDESPRQVEVLEIQVRPERQKRGLGSRVLEDRIAAARARDQAVRLSVGLKNRGAYRLYRRLGFKERERTDTHFVMVID